MTSAVLLTFGIYFVGVALVAAEALLIPGLGLPGFAGAGCIIFAAGYAWTTPELGPAWGLVLGGLALAGSLAIVVWVPRSRVGKKLTLKATIDATSGYDREFKRVGVETGHQGVTVTELKPSGFARFGDNRIEVRSGGEWIDRDVLVVVVAEKDGKLFVEAKEEEASKGES